MKDVLLILFKDKVFPNLLSLGKEIEERLSLKVAVFASEVPKEELEKVLKNFRSFEIISETDEFLEVIERVDPYLVLLPRPRISPLVHAFKKPWSEALVEETDRWNFLLVWEDTERIKSALVYTDRANCFEGYLKGVYKFLTNWGLEFKFVTVFDEEAVDILIEREYPEEEAKEILGKIFEDYISSIRKCIKEKIGLEEVDLIPLKGDTIRSLDFFAVKHKWDLVILPHSVRNKSDFVESLQTSLGLFSQELFV